MTLVLLEVYRNMVSWPRCVIVRTKDSDIKKFATTNYIPSLTVSLKVVLKPSGELWDLWGTSLKSSCMALQ